ncbi:MAG: thiamine pyrophosphate-binding protein [Leucobacter sp.]
MTILTVADLVGRALARLGAGHCFGVVGSGNFAVTNALREAGVPFTATRHEGGAATMADAYARVSGTVALMSVHQGCGLTNATTGIGGGKEPHSPAGARRRGEGRSGRFEFLDGSAGLRSRGDRRVASCAHPRERAQRCGAGIPCGAG